MILPFAGGVSPPFPVFLFCFQRVIHSRSRSYYLFFNYLFFNYLYGYAVTAKNRAERYAVTAKNRAEGYAVTAWKTLPNHTSLWK